MRKVSENALTGRCVTSRKGRCIFDPAAITFAGIELL